MTTLLIGSTMTAAADDYGYLTIEKSDGSKSSLTAIGTTITFADGNLIAVNGSEQATIALESLSAMRFTTISEGSSDVTAIGGIEQSEALTLADADAVFDLSGREIPKNGVKKGVYIIKKGSKTQKIHIR